MSEIGPPPTPAGAVEILSPGVLSLIQDLGRPGLAAIGVGRSGAADRAAFRRGAAAVGNTDGAAAIEVLMGGLKIRAHGRLLLAVTGAEVPVTVDGEPVDVGAGFRVEDGAVIAVGTAHRGLRCYLSVAGGIDVPAVLGSRSTDTLAGIGPARPRRGDLLPAGTAGTAVGAVEPVATDMSVAAAELPNGELLLRVVRGPRENWFADPDLLVSTRWTMSSRSDRIGLRLTGGTLQRSAAGRAELASEGMIGGCLQVPPNGEPVLLMPDHPVTGGYPVIGVVVDADVDRAAQARPGQSVRFRWVDPLW